MPEFEAILFDFDGVLADTEPVHWACWAQVLATQGLVLTWDFYRESCVGVDDREMLKMMAATADPPRSWESLWPLYPDKKALFQTKMLASPPFSAELTALLARLHQEYRLAVVSSSACGEIEPLLVAGGLRRYFDVLVGGDDVERHKPDPDPYLLAARRLGVRTALVVEDSEAGAASGRAAGFEVLMVGRPEDVPGLVTERLAAAPVR